MRTLGLALVVVAIVPVVQAQTDWPAYGHDPGGMRREWHNRLTAERKGLYVSEGGVCAFESIARF
jgi:hypothetical protein